MGNRPSVQSTYPRMGPQWAPPPMYTDGGVPGGRPRMVGMRPQSMYDRPADPSFTMMPARMPPPQLRRSQMSLNTVGGYDAFPERSKQASRYSLHECMMETRVPQPIFTDPKTLKKMEKKHRKLMKKLSGKRIDPALGPFYPGTLLPPPPMATQVVPPPPQFHRAVSYDNIHRCRFPANQPLPEEYLKKQTMLKQEMRNRPLESTSSGRGSLSPSPLTSCSPTESQNTRDTWFESRRRSAKELGPERKIPVQLLNRNRTPSPDFLSHRTQNMEKVEKRYTSRSCTYSQPIPRERSSAGYSSSRSSVSGPQHGDHQSEIDFSWVRDEEKKLAARPQQKEKPAQLPMCYFGMEPPAIPSPNVNMRRNEATNNNSASDLRAKLAYFEREAKEAERERQQARTADQERWHTSMAF